MWQRLRKQKGSQMAEFLKNKKKEIWLWMTVILMPEAMTSWWCQWWYVWWQCTNLYFQIRSWPSCQTASIIVQSLSLSLSLSLSHTHTHTHTHTCTHTCTHAHTQTYFLTHTHTHTHAHTHTHTCTHTNLHSLTHAHTHTHKHKHTHTHRLIDWLRPVLPICPSTRGVTVSMSAFLACHECYCTSSSLAWGLNLRAVVCGIFWSSSPGVFSGYSDFLPSFTG